MAFVTCTRPRSEREYVRMAAVMTRAPRVVACGASRAGDDGWTAACLRIAGRVPVWRGEGDADRARALLTRFGLPGLGDETPGGRVDDAMTLSRWAPAAWAPLPPAQGPLVTVLICTYNRAHLLPFAIASARAQTWPREIVVVDDGSDDGASEWLARQPDVRVLTQRNTGKSAALNRGIDAARGEALLVLDDDDELFPGALHVLGHALAGRPDLAAVCADTLFYDAASGLPAGAVLANRVPAAMTRRAVLQHLPAMPGATLVRMSAQRAAGHYDPAMMRGEDTDMFIRLSRAGDFEAVPFPVLYHRDHLARRGRAGEDWDRADEAEHQRRLLQSVRPAFLQRWREVSPVADRTESHAWAMGLCLRQLRAEARQEVLRWPAPHSLLETLIRSEVGISGARAIDVRSDAALVVVDDGDPGALEETLHRHAADHALWVHLEVPREPLNSVRLFWPGHYARAASLREWVDHPGPWHLRLASAPGWTPPPLDTPTDLPELPPREALLHLATTRGWPLPEVERPTY
jgi:GT2 family glycosyltransferase